MSTVDEIQRLAEEIGVDPEAISNTYGGGEQQRTVDIDLTTQSIVRFEPVDPASSDVGDYTDTAVIGNQQIKKVIKKRPQCPTCGYILTEERDPLHLPGKCYQCQAWVCPECSSECDACGRKMCPDHTGGHGLEDKPLCTQHAAQVEREQQHRRQLDRRQEERQDQKIRLEEERKRENDDWEHAKQREELEIKKQQKRFENRYKGKQLELKLLKAMIQAKNRAGESQSFQDKKQFGHLDQIEQSVRDKK